MLGTVPSEKRPVVADCGDLYRLCQPALRAGCPPVCTLRGHSGDGDEGNGGGGGGDDEGNSEGDSEGEGDGGGDGNGNGSGGGDGDH